MFKSFHEFVDRKKRECRKHLALLKKLFEKTGFRVIERLEDDDPYIYVKNTSKNVSFDGVRVYKLGDTVAYRVAKQEQTHPYGKAYMLAVEDMFDDFISEYDEGEAIKMVVTEVSKEMKKFFTKSEEAEYELNTTQFDRGIAGQGQIMLRGGGTDYSNQVHSKT